MPPVLRKFRWPIILFLSAMLFKLTGAWMKVTHQANADLILTIGFYGQILAVLIALVLIVRLLFTKTANDPSK